MNFLKFFLLPLAVFYGLATFIRNLLYKFKWLKSNTFNVPVISVGNLTVGGTGKTPHIEYLIRLLIKNYKVGTLSRGYKRKTSGFLLADPQATPQSIGDEPYQLYQKFKHDILVSVGEQRALAIPELLYLHPEVQVILLDDAFQHRSVTPSLNILLTDYQRIFYKDFLLPVGRLRESRQGASRADVIIVSKCPGSLSINEQEKISKHILQYSKKNVPVFFSSFSYSSLYRITDNLATEILPNQSVVLVSGIAQPGQFASDLHKRYKVIDHLVFADHYEYSLKDLENIYKSVSEDVVVVTTEKDAVKLKPLLENSVNKHREKFYYLPIQVAFLESEEAFNKLIVDHITIFYE